LDVGDDSDDEFRAKDQTVLTDWRVLLARTTDLVQRLRVARRELAAGGRNRQARSRSSINISRMRE